MTNNAYKFIIIHKLNYIVIGGNEMKKKCIKMMMCLGAVVISLSMLAGCTNKKEPIVMGTNAAFPPFEYFEGSEIVGFDVELAKCIADALNKELIIQDMEFAQLLGAVNTGKVDFIAAGMTATEDRAEQVDFSKGYFKSKQVIIVQEMNNDVATAEDLIGKKVGVQLGTTGDLFVSWEEGIEAVQYDKAAMAVADLVNGKVDAVIIDEEPAKLIAQNHKGVKLLQAPFIEEEYAIAVKKGNKTLLEAINQVLDTMQADGTYDALYEKYFGDIE